MSASLKWAIIAAMIGAVIGALAVLATFLIFIPPLPFLLTYGSAALFLAVAGPIFGGGILGALAGAPIGAALAYFDPFNHYITPSTNNEERDLALSHLIEANTILSEEVLPTAAEQPPIANKLTDSVEMRLHV